MRVFGTIDVVCRGALHVGIEGKAASPQGDPSKGRYFAPASTRIVIGADLASPLLLTLCQMLETQYHEGRELPIEYWRRSDDP